MENANNLSLSHIFTRFLIFVKRQIDNHCMVKRVLFKKMINYANFVENMLKIKISL